MQMLNQYSIAAAACEVLPQYDVKEAYLFGSYARNEADGNSDVDLCVECGKSFTLFSLGGIGIALEEALGRPVDVICGSDSFHPHAQQRYLEDRRLIYAKS
ncbi:MAG: nucleotidyltransferase domain-containing protein [Coriobacteriia bacterium]|nr:MAG: nucleotidyltransferase domain-containing protein [Coriobacteriia bacterium]